MKPADGDHALQAARRREKENEECGMTRSALMWMCDGTHYSHSCSCTYTYKHISIACDIQVCMTLEMGWRVWTMYASAWAASIARSYSLLISSGCIFPLAKPLISRLYVPMANASMATSIYFSFSIIFVAGIHTMEDGINGNFAI